MYQKTKQLIQLGKGLKTHQAPLRLQSPKDHVKEYNEQIKRDNKDILSSTHKLQITKSPSKSKIYPSMTTRQVSILNVQNSYTQLNNSVISVSNNQNSQFKQPFNERTNRITSPNQQERRFVRVNFINSSENGSRTSSSHLREFKPSPSKIQKTAIQILKPSPPINNRQLESKVKILENRIGELHKQKMQIVGKMNEQNRKLYHQNTSLKLNINQLQKKINRIQSQSQIKIKKQSIKSSKNLQNETMKIQQLQRQLKDLQSLLKIQYEKNGQLNKHIQQFLDNQQAYQQNIDLLTKEAENYRNLLAQKQEQLQHYKGDLEKYSKHQSQKTGQRQQLQSQIAQLKQILSQTLQKNQQVFAEYEQKIKQYQAAYDHNQQIILQLTNQLESHILQTSNNNPSSQTNNKQFPDNQIQFDYLQFEKNLNNAITERDDCLKDKNQQIAQLRQRLNLLEVECNEKQIKIKGLVNVNDSLQLQLTKVNSAMDVYAGKINEMQSKYEQIHMKYEAQKQKVNRSDGFNEKCKKCDELMRTIFRLNSHLNSKKI